MADSKPRTVAVIQARLGSSRLPRKVLADLAGRPMLAQIVARVRKAERIDDVVIATTTEPSDDDLEAYCNEAGLPIWRGSTDDLVERILGAARFGNADFVVRVWGDCPFIDPVLIDQALARIAAEGAEHGTTTPVGDRTFPVGVDFEVYATELLRRIVEDTEDPFYREFPFEFIAAHEDTIGSVRLRHEPDQSDVNLTVDYPEDLELARRIYAELGTDFGFQAVVQLLDELDSRAALPRNIEYNQKKSERT